MPSKVPSGLGIRGAQIAHSTDGVLNPALHVQDASPQHEEVMALGELFHKPSTNDVKIGSFGKLSPEILNQILELLRTSELASLSKTCKSFRRLAIPYLYRSSISLNWAFHNHCRSPQMCYPAINELFHNIREQPQLTSHITRVRMRVDWDSQLWGLDTAVVNWDNYDIERLWNTVSKMKLSDSLFVADRTRAAFQMLFIPLVLSRLRSLEYMEIDSALILGCDRFRSFWNPFTRVIEEEGFPFLKEVTLFPTRDRTRFRHSDLPLQNAPKLIGFFKMLVSLPCLEKIDMVAPDPYAEARHWEDIMHLRPPPASQSLRTIILRHAEMNIESLRELILPAAPNLEVLQYDFVYQIAKIDYETIMSLSWNELYEAISPFKQCLKSLKISTSWYRHQRERGDWKWPEYCWEIRGTLGSLADFERLETLEVPVHVLLGWNSKTAPKLADVLPPNLRELCLRDDNVEWPLYPWMSLVGDWKNILPEYDAENFAGATCAAMLLDQLDTFLGEKLQTAPLLANLTINHMKGYHWDLPSIRGFRSLCRKANITGKIRSRMIYGVPVAYRLPRPFKSQYNFYEIWRRNNHHPCRFYKNRNLPNLPDYHRPTLPDGLKEDLVPFLMKEFTVYDPSDPLDSQSEDTFEVSCMHSRMYEMP